MIRLAPSLILTLVLAVACDGPTSDDADGDGVPAARDCDDNDPDVGVPAEFELCNGIDDDCNGRVDDNARDGELWYRDADGDGFGAPDAEAPRFCEPPTEDGWADNPDDCDDGYDTIYPGADELCDTFDNDCDEVVDEDPVNPYTFYEDADDDGWGNADSTTEACSPPDGYVGRLGDCDDTNGDVNRDADEICNDIDDDCDSEIDEDDAVDAPTWWPDLDEDGAGAGVGVPSCTQPSGMVGNDNDCDDTNPNRFPLNPEVCDAIDNDCDEGTLDDGMIAVDGVGATDLVTALGAASAGSTITVCSGEYTANLDIGIDLTIEGPDGSDVTILTPAADGPILTLGSGTKVTVSNVTLQGASGSLGGAIDASEADMLTLRGASILDNLAESGGGVYMNPEGTLTASDTTFAGNVATDDGGGVYAGTLTFERVTLEDNAATRGGGLALDGGDAAFDIDTLISGNEADRAGGGIAILGAHQVSDGEVEGNTSVDDAGGIWVADGGKVLQTNVHDNTADANGGGLVCAGDCTLETVLLTDNLATDGAGAAFLGAGTCTLTSVELTGNVATDSGGGLYLENDSAEVYLVGGIITGNDATSGGGAAIAAGLLDSDTADWGTSSTDNTPDDVWFESTSYDSFGSSATFTCDPSSGTCE